MTKQITVPTITGVVDFIRNGFVGLLETGCLIVIGMTLLALLWQFVPFLPALWGKPENAIYLLGASAITLGALKYYRRG
jgi:hypothetical protein